MNTASENLEFERAIEYRELINSVKRLLRNKDHRFERRRQRYSGGSFGRGRCGCSSVFYKGRTADRKGSFLSSYLKRRKTSGILDSFIKQYYAGTPYIPGELMIQEEIKDRELIETWLTSKRGQKVTVKVPKKGTKEKLVELASDNAKLVLSKDKERMRREEGRTIGAVKEIEALLGISQIRRMEAYDISNTNGFESVGSMVVYERGKPNEMITESLRSKESKAQMITEV